MADLQTIARSDDHRAVPLWLRLLTCTQMLERVASGDVPPDYGCEQARKEQFKGQAGGEPEARQAFMTIMAYGHTEEIA